MIKNKNELTLGSLFDGSGGFPLAGILAGVTPLWASEIEPFAVRVTTARLPQMKHYSFPRNARRTKGKCRSITVATLLS